MAMFEHLEGYAEARREVLGYDRKRLLELMDTLSGRPAGWQALSDAALQRSVHRGEGWPRSRGNQPWPMR